MSILDTLGDERAWCDFLSFKKEKTHLTKTDEAALTDFIDGKGYLEVYDKILRGEGFYYPTKKLVNKLGSTKKRVVYTFSPSENYALKLLCHLLKKYDGYFSENLFSFRSGIGVKNAVNRLVNSPNIGSKFGFKADVSDYFNSIDVDILCEQLSSVITDDEKLLNFLKSLLRQGKSVYNNEVISESRGAMAGTPISPFFANVYLSGLDKRFIEFGALYARYSDDIIVFASTREELDNYVEIIKDTLTRLHLKLNDKKVEYFSSGESWSFLGFKYLKGDVDLSDVTIEKIKGKIRRKARSIYRWKTKKGASDDRAVSLVIKKFNRKFFIDSGDNDLNWSRWFFPLITVDVGLKEVDGYLQDYLRYVATGRFNKRNYEVMPYEKLKSLGYRSLVNEFYKKSD